MVPPDACVEWKGLSQKVNPSLEHKTAFCRSGFLFLVGNSIGVLVRGGWCNSHCDRMSEAGSLQICTRLVGSAIAGQNQLDKTSPTLLHWQEPLEGRAFFLEASNFPLLVVSLLPVLQSEMTADCRPDQL